ncbi:MAG TPA: ABC transporter permease [Vicinamibacterales bacterium]
MRRPPASLALRVYRLLLLALPSADRHRAALDLEAGFTECMTRERARLGRIGVVYAAVRIFSDTAAAAVALRMDARARRRVQALAVQPSSGDSAMSTLWQDVRYSVRVLVRAPGFSLSVVAILALAIGASTTVFTVVNTVLLRSLPFPQPDRLAMVYEAIPGALSGPIGFSAPDFKGLEQRARSFESVAAFGNRSFELSGIDQPERVTALRTSAALFSVLGVPPAIGQVYTREDDEGRRPVAVLSDGLWRRKFGADPAIIGRAVILDRRPYTVLGVMPRSFVFPNRGPLLNNAPADLFIPISFTDSELNGFGSMYNNSVVARLASGVTVAQADAEVRAVAANLVRDIYPAFMREGGFAVSASAVPLRDETVGRVERLLYVLLGTIGVVLLIACADVANLMLTRAAARGREVSVRCALGAGRAQLARQVLVEALLLATVGGAAGVLAAYLSQASIAAFAPPSIPRLHELSLDWRVLLFAAGVTLLTATACGVLPALELSRRQFNDSLKEGNRGATPGVRQRRIFGALVAAQFALAIVLLVGGGLLIRSFSRLLAVDPGFRAARVLTLSTSLPAAAYARGEDIREFYRRLLEAVNELPGVRAAGASTDLPLSVRERRAFSIEAQPAASASLPHVVAQAWVIGSYFDAFGVALKRGRFLVDADSAQSEPVAVINETMARQFWPGADPVGQRIKWGGAGSRAPWMRIVGVVGDVKQGALNSETVPQTYTPWRQVSDQMVAENVVAIFRSMKLAVRTENDPLSVASAIRDRVHALDPSLPVAQMRTMEMIVDESTAPQRFNTTLLGGFAGVALLLAAIGIGGVLATGVSRRTQEIGLRMALGASRADVLTMILRQGMTLVVIGVAIGLPTAFIAARYMSTLLFGVGPHDAITFASATILLVLVALVACYVPARRATRVDPMVALRWE